MRHPRIRIFRLRSAAFVVFASLALLAFLIFHRRYAAWEDAELQASLASRVSTPEPPDSESPSKPNMLYEEPAAHAEVPVHADLSPRRANATMLMLARNSDMWDALLSVRALEDRFNRNHHYPWVFLNDEEFSEEFQLRMRALIPESHVEFGVIPPEHWLQPDWIDVEKQKTAMAKMENRNVKYGGNLSYHNMCRFNSGFFFKHPLLLKYKWYWRVEPKVKFHCDILQDPFVYLEDNNKLYGFTMSVYEIRATIPSLWSTVKEFMALYPSHILPSTQNSMGFISQDNGRSYNRCHFWSNFEIASLDLWRGEAYTAFFDHLDRAGGFYYERWGDAPIHTIAAALFLPKSQLHLFDDIGYQHDDWSHCPRSHEVWARGRCLCSSWDSFDYTSDSCRKWWDALG
ncbi:glycosyltransferase family 15 protein [Mycena amicta]|nr:glycosyltransferase family 15 protein [Mycena amicta]